MGAEADNSESIMWPFDKKQSLSGAGLLNGWTDWHSHILPGVDDGIATIEDSLRVLRYYESAGIEEVWCTPHIMSDIPNATGYLRARFAELQEAYNGSVKLHLGAENMLDPLFDERLADGDLLPLPDNCLLVETSYFNPPFDLWKTLEDIRSAGYWPVLAHPERYVYMGQKDYRRLVEMDVQLQLNLPSLAGLYGREVQRKAFWLLRKGWYRRSGSDLHRLGITKKSFEKKALPKDILELARSL